MAGNIFINYRRDESGHVAGRLHDSLAPTFGRNKLFMDVDNIPVGKDFESYLKSQVAVCDAMLAIIGPNWLTPKDEAGQRRLDNSEDFVVIEIAAALARDIPVVPVLVDGARMPRPSELPDSLKPLARRQAIQVRHTSFSGDAETLVKRLRDVLGQKRRWGVPAAIGAAAIAVLLLIGWLGFSWMSALRTIKTLGPTPIITLGKAPIDTQVDPVVKATREAEDKRKADEAEQQRMVAKAEQERQARAAAEAEDKRKAEQAEQQRLAAKAEQERQARAAAEAEAEQRRLAALKVEEDRRRAEAEKQSRISDAIKQGSEANKTHDFDKAIANYNEAIRLKPDLARAFCNRGIAKLKINDATGNQDKAKARELDASACR